MQPTFIAYASFDRRVAQSTSPGHYQANKHLLPFICLMHRQRFLSVLSLHPDISKTAAIVDQTKTLPEKCYERYLYFLKRRSGVVEV